MPDVPAPEERRDDAARPPARPRETDAAEGAEQSRPADEAPANEIPSDRAPANEEGGPTEGNLPERSDPVTDLHQRHREAGADALYPFGRPGRPLGRAHPFIFGFVGALGVLTAWGLIQAITSARQVLILIVISLFLAIGLNPAVEALKRVGLSRGWSVASVFLGTLLFFVGFGFAIAPPLTQQITEFIDAAPEYVRELLQNPDIQELDQRYQILTNVQNALTSPDLGQQALGGIVGVGRVVLGGIFSTLTILILTLYFLSSLPNITGLFYRLAPRSRRARIALLGDEILTGIGGYVSGQLTVSFIAGVTTWIFLLITGVPYSLALALVVAITALVPLIGATIGAILVTIVAFFDSIPVGIATAVFFLIYQQIENYIIAPRIMKKSVNVQPAVTVIAALIGGTLLGVVGALLAIPTAAAISLIVREVVMPRQEAM